MEKEEPIILPSEEYQLFLKAIVKNGAYVQILTEGKESKNFYVKKGSENHGVTDENLIGFRPLTRKEQRAQFHTPFKYNRRMN